MICCFTGIISKSANTPGYHSLKAFEAVSYKMYVTVYVTFEDNPPENIYALSMTGVSRQNNRDL